MQLKKSMLDDNVSVYQEKIENIWLSLLQDLVITISGSEIANYGLEALQPTEMCIIRKILYIMNNDKQ